MSVREIQRANFFRRQNKSKQSLDHSALQALILL